MRQHQNCSFASVQAQTFRIGFQTLSRLANSTLKLCFDVVRQIVTMVISRISLRQDHICGQRRIVKLKWIIGLRVNC